MVYLLLVKTAMDRARATQTYIRPILRSHPIVPHRTGIGCITNYNALTKNFSQG